MEEETERMKEEGVEEEEDRCDGEEMQLLTSSPRPGETSPRSMFASSKCRLWGAERCILARGAPLRLTSR